MDDRKPFTCTACFEERDFVFLTNLFAPDSKEAAFRRYVADREELLAMLDDERVLQAVLESPTLLNVSAAFYFYVLVRHSLKRSSLDDVALADYLGAVLAERVPFSPTDALRGIPAGFVHTVDFLGMLDQATGTARYELLVAAGNQFLVLTGIFPDYIRRRSERHGAPGISFYESFARSSFLQASDCALARKRGMRDVFDTLTQVFPQARRSLNYVADSLVFLAS